MRAWAAAGATGLLNRLALPSTVEHLPSCLASGSLHTASLSSPHSVCGASDTDGLPSFRRHLLTTSGHPPRLFGPALKQQHSSLYSAAALHLLPQLRQASSSLSPVEWQPQHPPTGMSLSTQRLTAQALCNYYKQATHQLHTRGYAVIKDLRPATLDDVVRRHRNSASLITGFMVIELYPNGALLDLPTPLSAADLGIPFRDAMLFSSENSVTDQKPTIIVRQSSILFKSEAIRAVINENKAYIVKVKTNRSYTSLLDPLVETVKQDDAIPFELNVLEGLLYISCRWFDSRIKHLKAIMDGLMRDVHDGTEPFAAVYNEALIQQLAPLDKAITSLRNGSRGTCEAVRHLLENETMLADICLTQRKRDAKHAAEIQEQLGDSGCAYEGRHTSPVRVTSAHYNIDYLSDKEQARRMLESYDRELDAISGELEEMRENLDTVRDSWSMKLDSARNHIILLNLKMTLASLCLMLATMLPSWGGMNIAHGLPDEPWVFWTVSGVSIAVGVVSYPIASGVYKRTWRRRSRRDLLRFHSLRAFLVEHLDDLDDVMDAMKRIQGKMNRVEFERYMRDAMPSAVWKPASLDFLFSQYDLNKDGFLEGIEITKQQAQECGAEQEHLPDHLFRSANVDDLYNQERDEPQNLWGRVRRWMGVHQDQSMADFIMHGKSRWSLKLEERSGGRIIRH